MITSSALGQPKIDPKSRLSSSFCIPHSSDIDDDWWNLPDQTYSKRWWQPWNLQHPQTYATHAHRTQSWRLSRVFLRLSYVFRMARDQSSRPVALDGMAMRQMRRTKCHDFTVLLELFSLSRSGSAFSLYLFLFPRLDSLFGNFASLQPQQATANKQSGSWGFSRLICGKRQVEGASEKEKPMASHHRSCWRRSDVILRKPLPPKLSLSSRLYNAFFHFSEFLWDLNLEFAMELRLSIYFHLLDKPTNSVDINLLFFSSFQAESDYLYHLFITRCRYYTSHRYL